MPSFGSCASAMIARAVASSGFTQLLAARGWSPRRDRSTRYIGSFFQGRAFVKHQRLRRKAADSQRKPFVTVSAGSLRFAGAMRKTGIKAEVKHLVENHARLEKWRQPPKTGAQHNLVRRKRNRVHVQHGAFRRIFTNTDAVVAPVDGSRVSQRFGNSAESTGKASARIAESGPGQRLGGFVAKEALKFAHGEWVAGLEFSHRIQGERASFSNDAL